MSNLAVFSFENSQVRTFGTADNPLFVFSDVCAVLQHSNHNKALGMVDPEDVTSQEILDKLGRKQTVKCVNESGLYALIFKSRLESAKRFKRWVTSEVLPAIRKTGKYACPIATLTPAQQLQLREAVAKRAKAVSAHYQTIYRALYARFQVPRYTEILAKDFDAAIEFVRTLDLRVPERRNPDAEPAKAPTIDKAKRYTVSADFLERQRVFVYYVRYLFREEIDRLIEVMRLMHSPHAGMLWDAIHNINLAVLEENLESLGFPVRDLDCYQHWALTQAKAS